MVSLDAATPADATLLANLLELYIYDLSDVFPDVQLGQDGRFGYPKLALYWCEPDRRFAFVIRVDAKAVGFVLATRGSPVVEDPAVLDVAEFFVLRRYRGVGVGTQAASLLWRRLPGQWTVRVSEGNARGLAFWQHAIGSVIGGDVTTFIRSGRPTPWRVYLFDSTPLSNPEKVSDA